MLTDTTQKDDYGPSEALQPDQGHGQKQAPKEPRRSAADHVFEPDPDRYSCPPKTALARVLKRARTPGKRKARDRSVGESGDRYPGALFLIPGTNYRIAVCAKGYCWMLQQREAKDHWISRKFFSNKRRLATVLPDVVGPEAAARVMPQIEALPI